MGKHKDRKVDNGRAEAPAGEPEAVSAPAPVETTEPPRGRTLLTQKLVNLEQPAPEPPAPEEPSSATEPTLPPAGLDAALSKLEGVLQKPTEAEREKVRVAQERLTPLLAAAEETVKRIAERFAGEVKGLERIAALDPVGLRGKGYDYARAQRAVDQARAALNLISNAPSVLAKARADFEGLTPGLVKLGWEARITADLRLLDGYERTIEERVSTVKWLVSELAGCEPEPLAEVGVVQPPQPDLPHVEKAITDFNPFAY